LANIANHHHHLSIAKSSFNSYNSVMSSGFRMI
jgi:hypothetical protein